MTWHALQLRLDSWWLPLWWQARQVRSARRQRHTTSDDTLSSRQLFIDVSVIAWNDAGTGIQRVVRSIARALLDDPPAGWHIVPVGATRKQPYMRIGWPNVPGKAEVAPLDARRGDVFLGLDLSLDPVYRHRRQLRDLSARGTRLWFVMYDLLPAERPDWFSPRLAMRYHRWMRTIAAMTDGVLCISPDVAGKFREHLRRRFGLAPGDMPDMRNLSMGWDVQHAPSSRGVSDALTSLESRLQGRLPILMVGTLEPRKGHADALDAFELLDRQSPDDYALVIVGKPGWNTAALQQRLRTHPRLQRSIFWLDQATDDDVARLYQLCAGVLVASHAEGFGLPIVEALGNGKPVLARDIAVFHTLSSDRIDYFAAESTPNDLATRLREWLKRGHTPERAAPSVSLPTWHDATRGLVSSLQGAG